LSEGLHTVLTEHLLYVTSSAKRCVMEVQIS